MLIPADGGLYVYRGGIAVAQKGWVSLFRKLLNWEWYQDSHTVHLFIHLLLKANHADSQWQGNLIKRGQLITGRKSLSVETGITEQSVRTSLRRLKSTGEISEKSTSKFTIITLCNYDTYQLRETEINQPANQQLTSDQPASNQQVTTNNNNNNVNNINNKTNTRFKKESKEFDELWQRYPAKDGKKAACRFFTASVKTAQDWQDINAALDNYLQSERVRNGYVKNGSTWFNNWRDWVEYRGETAGETEQQMVNRLKKRYGEE